MLEDLSAEGGRILFSESVHGQSSGGGDVFVRRNDGSPAVLLGEGEALTLSPDGEWVPAGTLSGEKPKSSSCSRPARARPRPCRWATSRPSHAAFCSGLPAPRRVRHESRCRPPHLPHGLGRPRRAKSWAPRIPAGLAFPRRQEGRHSEREVRPADPEAGRRRAHGPARHRSQRDGDSVERGWATPLSPLALRPPRGALALRGRHGSQDALAKARAP